MMRQQTMNELLHVQFFFTCTAKWIRNFIKVAVSLAQLQSSCVTLSMFVVYVLDAQRKNNTVRILLMK